jgi:hypothetical protein
MQRPLKRPSSPKTVTKFAKFWKAVRRAFSCRLASGLLVRP